MAAHGTLSAYNNDRCRCPRCREAARTAKARYRGGEGASQRSRPVEWEAVESEPGPVEFEPTWQPNPVEPEDSYKPLPAWRKRARQRSGGGSRETAVRNLRELVRTREGRKVERVAIAAAPVQLVPVQVAPVQAPTLGPGWQPARRLGELTAVHTYHSGRVDPGAGFRAPLVCGHTASTGAAPLAAGNSVFCEMCRTRQLVGYPVYTVPSKPERKRRSPRVRPSREPAQAEPSWPAMGLFQ
jgi:hypothetical protein